MPSVIRRSDMIEEQGEKSLTLGIFAVVLLVVGLVLWWFASVLWGSTHPGTAANVYSAPLVSILAGVAVLAGLIMGGVAASRFLKARKRPSITMNCPYCEQPVQFPAEPTEDWDCEHCHRQVQYENGKPVPIKLITCAFCGTEHKVSEKAKTYLCDRCNRPLKLTETSPNDPDQVLAGGDRTDDILRNYDVVLTQVGRRPNDVALALESLLICNLREARQRMENLPLTVTRNVPERKADAVRRRLRDLGATAVMRPTEDAAQAGPARR